MISVELADDVVAVIAIAVIEVGKIALFARLAARPALFVIAGNVLSARHLHVVGLAPCECLLGRILIGEPGVVNDAFLGECALERLAHDSPRFRRCLGHNHRDTVRLRNINSPERQPGPRKHQNEISGDERDPQHQGCHDGVAP